MPTQTCPHCGTPSPAGDAFCGNCRQSLTAHEAAPSAPGEVQPLQPAAPGRRRRLGWKSWLILLVLIAAAVVAWLPLPRYAVLSLFNGDPWVRGRPMSYWIDLYPDPEAHDPIRELGSRAVPALTEELSHERPIHRGCAASALGEIGPDAKPAIPKLVEMAWGDDSVSARKAACEALARIGPAAIPELATTLLAKRSKRPEFEPEENRHDRRRLARVIDEIAREQRWQEKPAAGLSAAVPALINLCRYEDRDFRETAALALAIVGPDAREAVPAVVEMLRLEHATVQNDIRRNGVWRNADLILRHRLVDVLGAVGPEADTALPFLFELIRDADDHGMFRSHVVGALRHIDPEGKRTVPVLEKMLRDESSRQRVLGAHLLEYYAEYVKEARPALASSVPLLRQALKDTDENVRRNAAGALKFLAPEGK